MSPARGTGGATPGEAACGKGCGVPLTSSLSAERPGGTRGKLRHGQARRGVASPRFAHSGDASRYPPVSSFPGGIASSPGRP